MTANNTKKSLDFSVVTNQENLARYGSLRGVLVLVKLPLGDEYGLHMPLGAPLKEGFCAYPVQLNEQAIHWQAANGDHIELSLRHVDMTEEKKEANWYVMALSSRTTEVVSQGVFMFSLDSNSLATSKESGNGYRAGQRVF